LMVCGAMILLQVALIGNQEAFWVGEKVKDAVEPGLNQEGKEMKNRFP